MSYSALYSCCTGARSMTFTTCGVIVGSRILVVTQRTCHAVGSCVNCQNTTHCEYHWPCSNPYNNCTRHYTTVGHSCKSVRQYAESAYQQNKMAARHAVKRVKKAVTLERSLFREIRELKIFCI